MFYDNITALSAKVYRNVTVSQNHRWQSQLHLYCFLGSKRPLQATLCNRLPSRPYHFLERSLKTRPSFSSHPTWANMALRTRSRLESRPLGSSPVMASISPDMHKVISENMTFESFFGKSCL